MGRDDDRHSYSMALTCIYSLVLLSGFAGASVMINIVQSNMRSVTTIAILNLLIVHFLFLLTIPFRLYYYASGRWSLGTGLCNMVSGMIHVHMHMAFLIYVVILTIRLVAFHRGSDTISFYRKLHAVAFSGGVWALVLVAVPCVLHFSYGRQGANAGANTTQSDHKTQCFNFGHRVGDGGPVQTLNLVMSTVVTLAACALTVLQAHVMVMVVRKHGRKDFSSQQEFWAQLKSLCIVLSLLLCFVPYHLFRMYYVFHLDLENVNEVFLCLTALSCFDVVTFMGRGSYCPGWPA